MTNGDVSAACVARSLRVDCGWARGAGAAGRGAGAEDAGRMIQRVRCFAHAEAVWHRYAAGDGDGVAAPRRRCEVCDSHEEERTQGPPRGRTPGCAAHTRIARSATMCGRGLARGSQLLRRRRWPGSTTRVAGAGSEAGAGWLGSPLRDYFWLLCGRQSL